ncbi:hypothetical protein TcG_02406 [Trypanosoma cruzi]|nr:hypothetical protein TcG_02406 [Trypanosoma cruzi]
MCAASNAVMSTWTLPGGFGDAYYLLWQCRGPPQRGCQGQLPGIVGGIQEPAMFPSPDCCCWHRADGIDQRRIAREPLRLLAGAHSCNTMRSGGTHYRGA